MSDSITFKDCHSCLYITYYNLCRERNYTVLKICYLLSIVTDHNESFILEVMVGAGGEGLKVPQTSQISADVVCGQ